MLRSAQCPECRALWRFQLALQDLPGDTNWRFFRLDGADVKAAFGIESCIFRPQPPAAHRDVADAAPFAVADLEDFVDQILRRPVALKGYGTPIRIDYADFAGFQQLDHIQHAAQQVQRLK